MKVFIGILTLAILIFISYCIGYYNAANDTAFILSSNSAKNSIATLNYLEKGNTDKIKKLHQLDAEANMAAVEDIYRLRGKITKIPKRFLLYHDAFSQDDEFGRNIIESLRPQYAKIANRTEAKPNKAVER